MRHTVPASSPAGAILNMRLLAVFLASSCIQWSLGYTPAAPGSEVAHRTAPDRRSFLTSACALSTSVAVLNRPALAADTATTQQRSSLEARSTDNIATFPEYGMDGSDIFYPPWFLGSWKAVSTTKQVFAPCGTDLFTGGKAAYDSVIETEVQKGDALEYRARFIEQLADGETSYVAADREYNAREIAKAAMGGYSMVDVPVATPNQFSCTLGGTEQKSFVNVDITTLKRKAEVIDERKFACSELVRQIVSQPGSRSNPNAPLAPLSAKDIETISIYEKVSDGRIECSQRTATYLVPSQSDPIAFKKWQMSQGRAVDVRYYDVAYIKQ